MQIPVLDAEAIDPRTQPADRTMFVFTELRTSLEETLVRLSRLAESDADREDWARVYQAAHVAARALQAAIAAIPGSPFDVQPTPSRELVVDAIRIDVPAQRAFYGERGIELSRIEFALLVALAREPTRVYTRAELMRSVWGYRAATTSRTLDAHASRLRRKIAAAGGWPGDHVISLWGVGYALTRP